MAGTLEGRGGPVQSGEDMEQLFYIQIKHTSTFLFCQLRFFHLLLGPDPFKGLFSLEPVPTFLPKRHKNTLQPELEGILCH
ncbi:hypothetical protein D1646_12270 [Pseudoflavonifractor sp. 60]|nr:hypothetical protein [Pseudoflavonifractor sp. 60]